ncbi:uncharacterized protein LOC132728536 [Ruditapes philippinarum]|uniref:uncharacterized protein LOC132728536 n=1 Tax=Ruditapes philippinarum TaxID=129788 RepID=UPI00295A83B7|nr:uncharacterized protein LOC132728536 [Ruditapes philippinarum]
MQTDHEKRLRFGRVIPCHVGGSVHEHRDRNEVLACIERHEEHKITKLTLQMLITEGKKEKGCAADEARASAELARGYAEKARAAAAKEITKAEYAKTNNEEAKTKNEEAKAKVEEAKAKVEEDKNKRIFELLKYSGSVGMNNIRMILDHEIASMATASDPHLRMNTLADRVPAVTSSDELV